MMKTVTSNKEPTRLGDWQLDQEIDGLLSNFHTPLSFWADVELSKGIKNIVFRAIKRHERTLRRHGFLVETKQTELEKKEEETHA